ncbi:complement component C6 [Synchiropus picturatus]
MSLMFMCCSMMAPFSFFFTLLQLLSWGSLSLACFCDRYPWSSWSICSKTCNHGTQHRNRNVMYDDYFWKNSCQQLCQTQDTRACHEQSCPIDCVLNEFGPWSDCSSCTKKQYRTRSVQRPAQFGGSACSEQLTEERACHPSSDCMIPQMDCKDKFKCDNGRCINTTLTCNRQNDCGDNSEERNCDSYSTVCPTEKRVAPGADLVGNGFDALAQESKGAVLDNMFMGESCTIKRPASTLLYHRIPHNFESFNIKVGEIGDFNNEPQKLHSETINLKRSSSSTHEQCIHIFRKNVCFQLSSNRNAFEASKKTDSEFLRIHQVLPVSTFKVRAPDDLVLSGPFLQFLHALPLEYNYALYREIFLQFGTHYYSSGTLGGHYDMLYQYSREELRSSGESEEHIQGCLAREIAWTAVLYTQHRGHSMCRSNKMTEKYQGSYVKAAQKSFSQVKGGRAREAASLAWEGEDVTPNQAAYRNWVQSVLDNPAIVSYEVLSIVDLVKGIPCAVTKRRHLRRALLQYLQEFDTCKCSPCPNNGRPVRSGGECKCVCQTGTFGENCELRAPDYTSERVDGYWSCWGPWTRCGAFMKRHRTRRCDNPAPQAGGKPCEGPDRNEESCHVSIFEKKETCDNDDDYTVGLMTELPLGVQGCLRPTVPANSFLRKAKEYYNFGEDEEFQCFTGFDLIGFQYINCLPDGTWTAPKGQCTRRICLPPEIPEDMELFPTKEEYKVGDSIGLDCREPKLFPHPSGFYQCSSSFSWEPTLPASLRCTAEIPGEVDTSCGPGQRRQNSKCVCVPRQSCMSDPNDICVLNSDLDLTLSMSTCYFTAARCHGDPLFFISNNLCSAIDAAKLDWGRFRVQFGLKSSVQEPCGLDICFEWETCSASQKCECRPANQCPRSGEHKFCVRLLRIQRIRRMDLCSMAAIKCVGYDLEIIDMGLCDS